MKKFAEVRIGEKFFGRDCSQKHAEAKLGQGQNTLKKKPDISVSK